MTARTAENGWTIYTPNGTQSDGSSLMCALRDAVRSRSMAWQFLVRDLSAQYRQSLLGYVWAIVPALALVLGFTLAGQANILNTATTSVPYPLFALVGVVLWQTFADALQAPIGGVKEAEKLLARISVPPESLVLARVGSVLIGLAIRLVMIAGMMCWYRIDPAWSMLASLPALLVLLTFGLAIGLLLAPMAGLYDDVGHVVGMGVNLWFVLTPVMYEQAAEGTAFSWINSLNPMTAPITTVRQLMIGAPVTHSTGFWIAAAVAVGLLAVGLSIYRTALTYVVERQAP